MFKRNEFSEPPFQDKKKIAVNAFILGRNKLNMEVPYHLRSVYQMFTF